MTTCGNLPPTDYDEMESDLSTCSSLVRHVSLLVRRVNEVAIRTNDGYGVMPYDLLARSDASGRYMKIREELPLFATLMEAEPSEEYSENYPKWGIASDGELGALPTWERPTRESASSSSDDLWSTPRCAMASMYTEDDATIEARGRSVARDNTLARQAAQAHWPTPSASDGMGSRTLPEGTTATGMTQDGKKRMVGLNNAVAWPTPRASDSSHGGPNQRDSAGRPALPAAVHQWPTPRANSSTGAGAHGDGGLKIQTTVAMSQPTKGQLSSRWVSQLQGLPPDYLDIPGPPVPAKSNTRTKRPG